ncbi:MAG: hypothetical protein AAGD35_23000 [Actinomycetota bacterium]
MKPVWERATVEGLQLASLTTVDVLAAEEGGRNLLGELEDPLLEVPGVAFVVFARFDERVDLSRLIGEGNPRSAECDQLAAFAADDRPIGNDRLLTLTREHRIPG